MIKKIRFLVILHWLTYKYSLEQYLYINTDNVCFENTETVRLNGGFWISKQQKAVWFLKQGQAGHVISSLLSSNRMRKKANDGSSLWKKANDNCRQQLRLTTTSLAPWMWRCCSHDEQLDCSLRLRHLRFIFGNGDGARARQGRTFGFEDCPPDRRVKWWAGSGHMRFKMVVVLMVKRMNPHSSRAGKLVLPLGIERKNQISISRVTQGHSWDSISHCPPYQLSRVIPGKSWHPLGA